MKYLFIAAALLAAVECAITNLSHDGSRADGNYSFSLFPTSNATNVNPDTHLVLTFTNPPKIGTSGRIQVYDAADHQLVDTLDMAIPPSPNPSGREKSAGGDTKSPSSADPKDKTPYQINIIAGYDYHFFPIIVRGNVATIYLHNGKLKYGHTYYVRMDAEVIKPENGDFAGLKDNSWNFTTKASPPAAESSRLVVAGDGSGDFNTVQAAVEFVPSQPSKRVTIFIKDGNYEEIVVVSRKANMTIRGQSRDKVLVGYPNNSAFNNRPGSPSRRAAFTVWSSTAIQLSNFTISNYFVGQAEALLMGGAKNIVDHMTLNGSGDAFTTYGTIYFADSHLTGHGDTVLGYASVFFLRSRIDSIGPVTWTRTKAGQHGNIFVNSTIAAIDEPLPWTVTPMNPKGTKSEAVFARLPFNGPKPNSQHVCTWRGKQIPPGNFTQAECKEFNFPNAEMVLINTKTSGVPASGWGAIQKNEVCGCGFDASKLRLWEFNTTDMNGDLIDMSGREKVHSKRLTMESDAQTIANYSRPEFVLDGWIPVVDAE